MAPALKAMSVVRLVMSYWIEHTRVRPRSLRGRGSEGRPLTRQIQPRLLGGLIL